MSYYYLEITRGSEVGKCFPLPDGTVSIGRSPQNNIALPSLEKIVSGCHAIINKCSNRIVINDLHSTNGTYIDEIKVTEKELFPGNEIGFGKAGPRLKLIESSTEFPIETHALKVASLQSTTQKTVDE